MATYIPSSTGWAGSGVPGNNGALRFEVVQSYDANTNKSTLTIYLQARRTSNYALNYNLIEGSVQIGSSGAESVSGLVAPLHDDQNWHNVTSGGSTKTWTRVVQHDSNGAASVTFKITGINLYQYYGQDYNIRFSSQTSTLSLSGNPKTAPTMGTPTASVVDLTGNYPSTYIAGYSKVKLAVSVTKGSGNISSVVASYSGGSNFSLTYNSGTGKYEGTSAGPITGNTTFTITATAADSMTASKTVSVTGVVPYTTPTITIDEANTYRCDSGGTKTDGGAYYRVKATANYYSSLSGNSITTFNVKIKGTSSTTNLTSGSQSGAISGMSGPKARYTIVLTVQDKVSSAVTREYGLNGMQRNLVLQRTGSGTQVGIGTTPTSSRSGQEANSFVELPSGGMVIIGSIAITDTNTNPGTKLTGTWTAITQTAIPGLYFWSRS